MKKKDKIKKLLPEDATLLGKWFDTWIIFDAGKEEFWWLPKIQKKMRLQRCQKINY